MAVLALIFDLLKGIAWPLAIVVIAFLFKSDLKLLLPRIREAGPTGVKFDPIASQQKAGSEAADDLTELKDLPGFSRTEAIAAVERNLRASLQQIDEGKRFDVLVRVVAEARLVAFFERIYGLIFGSQIQLLRLLNIENLKIDAVKAFFDTVQAQYPEVFNKSDAFDSWLGFLIGNGLVRRSGDEVEITEYGRDFLVFLTGQRLPENKQY